MTPTDNPLQQIVDLLSEKQKVLIMASSPADGDCIGSSLGLYLVLKKLNKETTVVCPDKIPGTYHFLPSIHLIGDRVVASKDFIITINTSTVKTANIKMVEENGRTNIIISPENGRLSEEDVNFNYGPERYDLIITVDTGGIEQLGQLYAGNIEMFHQVPVINIDHHFSNEHHGSVNYVDPLASSTTELLIPVIEELEKKTGKQLWDEDIATLLLTGIITDTGSFQNSNTTPRAFDASAKLVAHGAHQQEIIQHIFKTKQLTTLKLWGRILTKMQLDEKFHIVWSVITRKDFEDTGSEDDETGGIVDELLSNAPGAEIVLLLKERTDGIVSGSIRSTNPSIEANKLAETFGGGGHVQAAGFKIADQKIDAVVLQVLKVFREYQSKRLGIPLEEEVAVHTPISAAPIIKAPAVTAAAAVAAAPAAKAPVVAAAAPMVPAAAKAIAKAPAVAPTIVPVTPIAPPVTPAAVQPKPAPVSATATVPAAAATTKPIPAPAPTAEKSGFQFKEPIDPATTDGSTATGAPSTDTPETPYKFER